MNAAESPRDAESVGADADRLQTENGERATPERAGSTEPETDGSTVYGTGAESPFRLQRTIASPASSFGGFQALQTGRRYQTVKLHRSGGLGAVWLTHDALLGRDVALKGIRPDRAAEPGHRPT